MNIEQLKAKLATLTKGTKEYNEVSEQIAKLEAETKTPDTKSGFNPKDPKVSKVVMDEFNRLAPYAVTKHKLTEDEAAKYLIQNDNDVKKAANAYKQDMWVKQVKAQPEYEEWNENADVQKNAQDMITAALNNLPEARTLMQEIMNSTGTDLYEETLTTLMPRVKMIYAGNGIDIVEEYIKGIKVFSGDLYPTAEDKARFKPENYSKVWKVTIGSTIYQCPLIINKTDYVTYFLEGKLSEYLEKALLGMKPAIRCKEYIECMALVKAMYQTTHAKASSTAQAKTNRLVGKAESFLDALKEFRTMRRGMLQHNTQFFYDNTCGAKYTYAKESDLIHLVPTATLETKDAYNNTTLTDNGVEKMAGKFLWAPETIFDPVTEAIINVDPFVDSDGEKLNGCIFAIDTSRFQRVENLRISNKADFPYGLTAAHSEFARFGQAFDPRGSVFLYENEDALTQGFVVPVSQQEANNSKRKAKKSK